MDWSMMAVVQAGVHDFAVGVLRRKMVAVATEVKRRQAEAYPTKTVRHRCRYAIGGTSSSPFSFVAVQLEKLHVGRIFEFQAESIGDLPQRVVQVRKMIGGHVTHEGAAHFIVAHAAVQPSKKKEQLHTR
jgi:hypothetical protein